MPYGGVKIDNITFTNAGVDTNITVSGLYASTTSGLTVTGAILAGSGSAAAPSFSFGSDPDSGLYSAGANQVAISTNGTGRLFVDASGNINLGQSSSALQSGGTGLTVYGASASEIKFLNSTTGSTATDGTALVTAGVDFTINNREAGSIVFGTSNSEQLRITSSGLVGIGTSAPGSRLEVGGESQPRIGINSTGAGTAGVLFQGTGTTYGSIIENITTGELAIKAGASGQNSYFITFGTNDGTERARIDSSGRLLVGTSSDSGGALFQVNGDRIRVGTAKTPASASATGTAGEICWDANYIYVCTATNTWKRTAISTW